MSVLRIALLIRPKAEMSGSPLETVSYAAGCDSHLPMSKFTVKQEPFPGSLDTVMSSTVLFNDGPGDRQSQSNATRLGCVQRLEDPIEVFGVYSVAAVLNRNLDMIRVDFRRNRKLSPIGHGVAGIANQIAKYNDELPAIAENGRQFRSNSSVTPMLRGSGLASNASWRTAPSQWAANRAAAVVQSC